MIQSLRKTGGSSGKPNEDRDDFEVKTTRINLSNAFPICRGTQMSHHLLVQLLRLGVAQERNLVKSGSHRPLQPAIRISRAQAGKRVQSPLEFLAPIGHSLSKGSELSRHVRDRAVSCRFFELLGFIGQGKQGGYAFFQNDAKGTVNLQLLGAFVRSLLVIPLVSMLVTGLVRELFEPGLDASCLVTSSAADGLRDPRLL